MRYWLRKLFSPGDVKSRQKKSVGLLPKSDTIFAFDAAEAEELESRVEENDNEPLSTAGPTRMQLDALNVKYSEWLFGRRGEASVVVALAETEILQTLDELLKSNQSSANLVRRMPGVIPQLLQSLRTENFSGAQLARTISHDIVLVGEVIRLANGAYYNLARPITSIENAILMLGHTGLRQLITGVAFRPIIDMKSGYFTRLLAQHVWDQSEKSAMACRFLARMENVDSFEGFLAGLIQYVGLIASLRIMDQIPHSDAEIGTAGFCDSLIGMTRTLSCSIAREWHFPETVARAIEEQRVSGTNAVMSPLGKILARGDYLGKLLVLLEEGLIVYDDAVVQGLSKHELACLNQLVEVKEAG